MVWRGEKEEESGIEPNRIESRLVRVDQEGSYSSYAFSTFSRHKVELGSHNFLRAFID